MYNIIPEDIGNYIAYDPQSGELRWAVRRQAITKGALAGSIDRNGRLTVHFRGKRLLAHRIAWFLTTGDQPHGDIDHVDRNPLNNQFANLRLATIQQNAANRSSRGKLRTKGVTPLRGGRFMAQIKRDGINHYLGCFGSVEAAKAAYDAKAVEFFGEYGASA